MLVDNVISKMIDMLKYIIICIYYEYRILEYE
jgi:hypothetical protein